jgi:hypothetical protein
MMMMADSIIDGEMVLWVVVNVVWMWGSFTEMDVQVLAWDRAGGTVSHGARRLLHVILVHCFFIGILAVC